MVIMRLHRMVIFTLCCAIVMGNGLAAFACAPSTAGFTKVSSMASVNSLTVNGGDKVLFDVSSANIPGGIDIKKGGLLVFDRKGMTLTTSHILVYGELQIGTESCPFEEEVKIVLDGSTVVSGNEFSFGDRFIGVGHGGTLNLHGAKGKGNTWTKLTKTCFVGQNSIDVLDASGWSAGDSIVLASTDFDMNQAETFTITGKSGNTLSLSGSCKYNHFGEITYGVDERGEVALLSRSIRIEGKEDGVHGGHMMFHGGTKIHIQGIELYNMGQGDLIGRYPFHFHLAGDMPSGTYIKDSSIHKSNFRCVVLHGTSNVLVENNVAYDHFGHCVLTEDSSETNNVFKHNCFLNTKAKKVSGSGGVGEVGFKSDEMAPTTFWITHPDNALIDNVAGGSDDTGIWYLFRNKVNGISETSGKYGHIGNPSRVPLAQCTGNVVHSNRKNGFMIEPTNFQPENDNIGLERSNNHGFTSYDPKTPDGKDSVIVVKGLTLYKNGKQGFWFRGHKILVADSFFADMYEGITFASAGVHPIKIPAGIVRNSLFVGFSKNCGTLKPGEEYKLNRAKGHPDFNNGEGYVTYSGPGIVSRGGAYYDGTMSFFDCTFNRYEVDSVVHSAIGNFYHNTWQMSARNEVVNAKFDSQSNKYRNQFYMDDLNRRLDGDTQSVLSDPSGSVTGYRSSYILPDLGLHKDSEACEVNSVWKAAICPWKYVNVWISNENPRATQYNPGNSNQRFPFPGAPREKAIYIIRDQHRSGNFEDAKGDLISTGAVKDGLNNLFQTAMVPGASYSIHFPYVTPPSLKLTMANADVHDEIRFAICYPSGTKNYQVRRGLYFDQPAPRPKEDFPLLPAVDSMDNSMFKEGNAYFKDGNVIFVVLRQRYQVREFYRYCPAEGCDVVWIDAEVPTISGEDAIKRAGMCESQLYPKYTETSGPFFNQRLQASTSHYCGDGNCSNGETCSSCPRDCGICSLSPFCGDEKCSDGETCSSCTVDCGPCSGGCGDGICGEGETCESCPGDCGSRMECVPKTGKICRVKPGHSIDSLCGNIAYSCSRDKINCRVNEMSCAEEIIVENANRAMNAHYQIYKDVAGDSACTFGGSGEIVDSDAANSPSPDLPPIPTTPEEPGPETPEEPEPETPEEPEPETPEEPEPEAPEEPEPETPEEPRPETPEPETPSDQSKCSQECFDKANPSLDLGVSFLFADESCKTTSLVGCQGSTGCRFCRDPNNPRSANMAHLPDCPQCIYEHYYPDRQPTPQEPTPEEPTPEEPNPEEPTPTPEEPEPETPSDQSKCSQECFDKANPSLDLGVSFLFADESCKTTSLVGCQGSTGCRFCRDPNNPRSANMAHLPDCPQCIYEHYYPDRQPTPQEPTPEEPAPEEGQLIDPVSWKDPNLVNGECSQACFDKANPNLDAGVSFLFADESCKTTSLVGCQGLTGCRFCRDPNNPRSANMAYLPDCPQCIYDHYYNRK
eukprot:Nk52_evm6s261 gene=Nk52_evmTU6s261